VHHWQALYPYANPAHLTQLIDGLHKAGLAVDELERLPDTA
jgi:hypothetical protein